MFQRTTEPLALSEASLLALRPAMNAPVLNVDFLPVGPARAAVVVFGEEYGGIAVAIGVRSNESGHVVVLKTQVPLDPSTSIPTALEPALATAERMGFLFDEDMIESTPGGQGRAQAMALWGRLMGELEVPGPARTIPPEPAASEPILDIEAPGESPPVEDVSMPELLLDDIAGEGAGEDGEVTAEISLELSDELPPAVESAVAPRPRLSKFRKPESRTASAAAAANAEADAAEAGDGNELGRIELVRVRKGAAKLSHLARLLSSF